MINQKKCPHCGEWSHWQQQLTDRCEHCNELLEYRAVQEKAAWKKRLSDEKTADFFTPKETDGPFMLATRKIAFFFHLVFSLIAWLFIWSFASTPG